MKRNLLLAFVAVAFGCGHSETRARGPNISPGCEPVKGKMPPFVAGTAEARGVLSVAPAVVGRTIHVGLDYTTADGMRKTKRVGSLQPKSDSTRFRCFARAPGDATSWKFIFVAEPQEECGYYAELSATYEIEIEIRCRPEYRQTWETYRDHLGINPDEIPATTSDTPTETTDGVPLPGGK